MLIGAIADDLTGATDLALTLARAGLGVIQVVGVPETGADFGDAQAVVVALKSRTIPASEAIEQSRAAAIALRAAGARQLFFKYCSTFDSTDAGNIGPVTDALLDLIGESRTIACPAFPANGRTVYRGHLFVGDSLLSESSMKDHPLTPMRDANLVRVLGRQTDRPVSLIAREIVAAGPEALERAFERIEGIAIVDAIEEADLATIGRAARGLGLVTGGSAVAAGLAGNFGVALDPAGEGVAIVPGPGGIAVLAGSCSAATRGQIEAAIDAGAPALRIDPFALGTIAEAADFIAAGQGGPAPIVYSSADPATLARVHESLGSAEAGERVERFMAGLAAELRGRGITRFIVAGGETSGAVVEALGVKALRIGPEIDPGVPWTLSHGDARPIALALKSGNFGAPDFFLKAADMVS